MKTRTKKLAILLAVGVVLSSGAYALGSQAGNGGALASGSNASASGSGKGATVVSDRQGGRPGFRGGRGPALDDLATKLGVSETALRTALEAIRDEKTPAQRRAELTQALATALGKTPDQVTSALNSVLPDKPDRARGDFAADLAKALGVDAAKVQAGLDKARQDFRNGNGNRDRRGRRGGLDTVVNDIAAATGVDAAKVRSALQDLRPSRGDRRDRRDRRGDDIRQKLATALGVTTAQLDAAFDKVRTQAGDQFATELAQKLSIDPQKVKDALPDRGGFGFGFGRRHG
jgi:transcriptional regulator with XRE-family HTH domain